MIYDMFATLNIYLKRFTNEYTNIYYTLMLYFHLFLTYIHGKIKIKIVLILGVQLCFRRFSEKFEALL